jgi:hypothetical protein
MIVNVLMTRCFDYTSVFCWVKVAPLRSPLVLGAQYRGPKFSTIMILNWPLATWSKDDAEIQKLLHSPFLMNPSSPESLARLRIAASEVLTVGMAFI